jgi:hypothetical protein
MAGFPVSREQASHDGTQIGALGKTEIGRIGEKCGRFHEPFGDCQFQSDLSARFQQWGMQFWNLSIPVVLP